jgi:hypothetical protein
VRTGRLAATGGFSLAMRSDPVRNMFQCGAVHAVMPSGTRHGRPSGVDASHFDGLPQ